jgi:hypothetical protein
MTTWATMQEMSYGREVWEARLKEAEQARKVHGLPRRKPQFLLVRILAFLGNMASQKAVTLQELKV